MKTSMILIGSLFMTLVIAGSSTADLSDARKQKERSQGQREQAEQNIKQKRDKEKALQNKQRELDQKQKLQEIRSNSIKNKQEIKKGTVRNIDG